ncbi:GATA zinc finger domain containing 2Ab isoform X2 [Danio rerio]|uniref:GATA zinc finger domain containing 2Ab isoform X2 n=2 Tax=Danio rerio TaxID=7955 RepID=A0A8M2BHS0_DANRE|nr:transcriptional repressor p66-alpha isoform X2 [Danio rerio]|eukprot:XP_005170502.1 transcriptional repressor p66-alpha isoform X2 [Danio rerio]
MSSGSTCAVPGCHNNSKKLKSFQENICIEHQKSRNECPCAAPYALHCMPTKAERKRAWLSALKLKNPPKRVYVCSFHFVDKKPTELHPDPELYLGQDRPQQSKRKQTEETGGLGEKMSEDAGRQTRSQKRALERDVPTPETDVKRVKLERGEPGAVDGLKTKSEQANKVANILRAGEVKATIKVEVQTSDEPVDMSTSKSDIKKERPSTPDDDVIVLSDNEPSSPCMNGVSYTFKKTDTDMLMKSSPAERTHIIKQLQEELRLQEAKLVLLKKLRQSQIQKDAVQKSSNSVAAPPPLVRGSISSTKGPLQVSNRNSGTVIPPPLVRGGAQVSKHSTHNTVVMPPLVRGSQQIATLRQQQQQQHSGSGPPPLLLGTRTSVPTVQVQGQRIIQQGLIRVASVGNANVLVSQASSTGLKTSQSGLGSSSSNANDSPASRQAAAKLALRKQLEKTLLEIPPPKPPAPELNFLPSAANNEFIYLVGLEMVVQNLLDTLAKSKHQQSDSASNTAPKEPFTCAQCQTDFTSRWRQEKNNGSILCEHCMSSNQKKVLKAEHTSRLKAAFVKALQQEQEIEQRILQQAASPKTTTTSSSSSSSSPVIKAEHVLVSPQYKQVRASLPQQTNRGHYHTTTIKQTPGQLSRTVQQVVNAGARVSHSFSTSSQLQNAATAAALVSRPGKHAVRAGEKGTSSSKATTNTWRKQNSGTTGVTMAYVNPSLSVHRTTSPVDRQREYLLDMIPSRSISQTANTWK